MDPRVNRLLRSIGSIEHLCDVDLLVFLARHAHMLLTTDQLAAFVGYNVGCITASLTRLIEGGIVKTTLSPGLTARLFVIEYDGVHREALRELLTFANTRAGRLALRRALADGGRA